MRRYCLVMLFSLAAAATCRAGGEMDLLRKFQSENKAAADKLKQEADRLLNQEKSAAQDAAPLRKLLGQLQEDLFLPRDERTQLIRKLEDRLRDCNSLADKAVADPKIKVKQAVAVNTGPLTTIIPDGGMRVLAGSSSLAEGRNEYGVPGLGGIPYLGRGFRNVGSSRAAGNISISASVRIISMAEEEAKFLGR